MNLNQPMDEWFYTGAAATYGTFNDGAIVNTLGDQVNPPFTVDLSDTGHGLIAPSLLYIQNTTNYNGLRKIKSLPDADSMLIYALYVAETLSSATWKTMFTYDDWVGTNLRTGPPYEFLGFEVTLDAVPTTSEDLEISIDANVGSAFDNLIYSEDLSTLANPSINYMFDTPRKLSGGDKIDVVWANTDTKTWGIKLFTRRRV
jgi:hypothetical protein